MADVVPLCRPSIGEEEIEAVVATLRSGWMAHGEWNHKFERAFADYIGAPHAISMNSCTSALEAALSVGGIRGEVVIPGMTWVATANSVVTTGGRPVFCEVDEATRNVTAATIAERLTSRTEAVIVVHFGGQPCAMDEIRELCERRRLFLIEDSAETLGATWKGTQAGAFAVGCFSFFPTKNITTGEGGMLTCRDDDFARKTRAYIAHGVFSTTFEREKTTRPWLRAAAMAGHNFRMPNPLAALGYHQLNRLDDFNRRRQALAARYDRLLGELPGVVTPVVADGATHVYQMYTITVGEQARDRVVQRLRADGIGASVHFDPPVHLQPYYRECGGREGQLPTTERLARSLITLPMYPDLTEALQDRVVESLDRAVKACD